MITTTSIYSDVKLCKTCGEIKPVEEFHKTTNTKSGRVANCAVCTRAKAAAKYAENKKTGDTYYDRNRTKILHLKSNPSINKIMEPIYDAKKIAFTFTDKSIFYYIDDQPSKFMKNIFNSYEDGQPMCIEDKISHIRSYILWNSNIINPESIRYTPELR
jgi:hypothetical protein